MRELNCDIVVLGGGGSGMVAALRAAEHGKKKVIVLEKSKVTGGGANFATFMRTFDSKWQKERGIQCQTIDYIRLVQDEMFWQVEPELAANSVRATGEFVDWLMELEPSLAEQVYPGKYLFPNEFDPVGPQADNHQKRTFGRMVMDTMRDKAAEYGVELLTQTKAIDVEVPDGKITAVLAEQNGEQLRVECKACILATGSWICNEKIARRVCPEFSLKALEMTPHTNPAYTGDGIPIAEHAGAFVDYDSFCIRFMGPMPPRSLHGPEYSIVNAMLQSRYVITVNQDGRRYCSEPLNHLPFFKDGVVQARQPGLAAYQIFDMNCIKAASQLPRIELESHLLEVMGDPNITQDMDAVRAQMDAIFAKHPKDIYRADTLEELADQIGIDWSTLLETVANYNRACAEGRDWEFAKPADALAAINTAPYYAIKASPGTDGAFGGVRVNGRMEAYAADRKHTVEGLYVTGDFASGRYALLGGYTAQVLNDLSWAFASGFLAGTNASDYLDRA